MIMMNISKTSVFAVSNITFSSEHHFLVTQIPSFISLLIEPTSSCSLSPDTIFLDTFFTWGRRQASERRGKAFCSQQGDHETVIHAFATAAGEADGSLADTPQLSRCLYRVLEELENLVPTNVEHDIWHSIC
jgi:hypothetical protein